MWGNTPTDEVDTAEYFIQKEEPLEKIILAQRVVSDVSFGQRVLVD